MDEGQLSSWSELLDLSSKDHTEQSCALNVDFLKYIHCVVVRPIASRHARPNGYLQGREIWYRGRRALSFRTSWHQLVSVSAETIPQVKVTVAAHCDGKATH